MSSTSSVKPSYEKKKTNSGQHQISHKSTDNQYILDCFMFSPNIIIYKRSASIISFPYHFFIFTVEFICHVRN